MDPKRITRGDAVVGGSALIILIFSFLPFVGASNEGGSISKNMWWGVITPTAPAIVLLAVAIAIISIVSHTVPGAGDKNALGLRLESWTTPLSVVLIWNTLWTFTRDNSGLDFKYGGIIALLFSLVLGATVLGGAFLPALAAPLGVSGPASRPGAPYAAGPQQGYGAPVGGQPFGGAPQAAAAPAVAFEAYWFSVPDQRPLHDPNSNAQTNTLNPGVWYLAVQPHGQGLLVEVDGVRGVLWNADGIQKSS